MGYNALIGNKGAEVIQAIEMARAMHRAKYGADLPCVVLTETEMKEFLIHVRFFAADEVRQGGLPDGFPSAGAIGYTYRNIPINIIKPTRVFMNGK